MNNTPDQNTPQAKPMRRVRASHEWIEACIAVGQHRGLMPSKVIHGADGSVEVHFEASNGKTGKVTQGWDI